MRHDRISIPASIIEGLSFAPRQIVSETVAGLIDVLDRMDGDSDLEPNGDELDGTGGEEDFGIHCTTEYAAGCPIADPDCAADDFPIDQWDEDGI